MKDASVLGERSRAGKLTQAEGVEHNGHAAEAHGRTSEHGTTKAFQGSGRGKRDEHQVVGEGPGKVLPDDGLGPAGKVESHAKWFQAGAQQVDRGRSLRSLEASHCNASVGLG